MATTIKDTEFAGIYIAPEAALYLTATLKRDVPSDIQRHTVNARNVIRWIRVGLTSPQLVDVKGRELLMTFEDLVSMRVIAVLRALGVSWSKIHKAERWLRDKTDYPRPFAIEKVWTETVEIFAKFPEGFIAASRHGQLSFVELFGEHLQPVEDMTFIRYNGVSVASTWTPHDDIIINPKIQFGEPCIQGTRIRTRILWQMWAGGDSISYLIRAFELTKEKIEHALEWEDRLRAARETPKLSPR